MNLYDQSMLCDSGAEMYVVRSALVEDFSPNVVGQVQLRLFCGDVIQADLIRLTVFSEPETKNCSTDVWCAMIPNLYDDLILTSDVVDRLSKCNISRVMTRSDQRNSAKPDVNGDSNMSVTSRVTQDTTSNNVNDVSTSAVSDAVVNSPNLLQSIMDQSVCDQSIVDQSVSDKSVNDKSVLTESIVSDDDKVNDNDNNCNKHGL